jgi:hypothetical protein
MSDSTEYLQAFGIVDQDAEHGVLISDRSSCKLIQVNRTERGFPRRELGSISLTSWKYVSPIVQRELLRVMDPEEIGDKAPVFRTGEQALSPLVTRELAVLFWALMEDGEGTHIEALLSGWRQLAREERWWLYARASSPSQRLGHGWRHALYFALTDPADTRTAPRLLEIMEAASAQKKNSLSKPVNYRKALRKDRKAQKRAKDLSNLESKTQIEPIQPPEPQSKTAQSKRTTKSPLNQAGETLKIKTALKTPPATAQLISKFPSKSVSSKPKPKSKG